MPCAMCKFMYIPIILITEWFIGYITGI
jgi:hypothetical protein